MIERLQEAWESEWLEVARPAALGGGGLFGLLFLAVLVSEPGFVPLLDHINLAFHEAGHPILGILGATAGLYGGTLFQLLVPVAVAGSFWLRREPLGTAVAGWWFSENLLNVARYVADARAQLLPLVGGGEHDWWNILMRWGVPGWDSRIAAFVELAGWIGMLASAAWFAWRATVRKDPGGSPGGGGTGRGFAARR